MRSDLAPEITGKHTDSQVQVQCLRIDLTHSEVEQFNQNHAAEGDIWHLKKHFRKKMVSKKVPMGLWDYGLVHKAGILSRISRGKMG